MKGFTIEINNKKINAAVKKGVVLIVVDNAIGVSGTDNALGLSINWGHTSLDIGDKIKITASNIESNSPPMSMKLVDRQNLLTEYYELKKMLIKEGVLK